ncbi:hypothetical protein NP493_531g04020 [Ridgeia piscesae]|uniref:Uncharacterized protein n=1 Tax=Ridgeia piscesae TaxID=27915 RepID=A0AAD9KWM4_RIDPI|nr:hypothetical protein NP493_531g04020 [Ridgeia piscesae]
MLGPTEIKPPDAPQRSDLGGATKKANGIGLTVKRLQKMTTASMPQPTNGVYKTQEVKSTATLDQVKLKFMRSKHSGHVTKSDERLLRDFRRTFEPTVIVRRSFVRQQRGKCRRKKVASTPPKAQRAITGGASGTSHPTGITGVQTHGKPLKNHKPAPSRVEFTGPRHCSKAGTNLFESFGVGKACAPFHETDAGKCNGVSPPISRAANSILHEVNNGNNVDPKKTAKWRRTSGCSPVKKLNAHMKSSFVPASVTETYAFHASTISKVDPNRTSLPATPDPRHSPPMADRVKLPVPGDAGPPDHTRQQIIPGNATATEATGDMNQYYVVTNTALDLSTSKTPPKKPRKPTCYDRPRGEPIPAIRPISPYAVSRTQGDCRPSLVVTIRKTHDHVHAPSTKQPLMLQPSDNQASKPCHLSTQGKSKMAITDKTPCYVAPTEDTVVANSIVGGKPGDVPCKSPVDPKKAVDDTPPTATAIASGDDSSTNKSLVGHSTCSSKGSGHEAQTSTTSQCQTTVANTEQVTEESHVADCVLPEAGNKTTESPKLPGIHTILPRLNSCSPSSEISVAWPSEGALDIAEPAVKSTQLVELKDMPPACRHNVTATTNTTEKSEGDVRDGAALTVPTPEALPLSTDDPQNCRSASEAMIALAQEAESSTTEDTIYYQSEDTDEPEQRVEDCDTKEATDSHQDDICKVVNDSPNPSCTLQLETGTATLDLSPGTKDTSSNLKGDLDVVKNAANDEGVDIAIARNIVETDASPSTITPPGGNTNTDGEESAGSNITKEKSLTCEDASSLRQTLTEPTTADQQSAATTTTSVAAAHSGNVADPEETQLETKRHTEDASEEDDDNQPEMMQKESSSGPRESNNADENNEKIPPLDQCVKGAVDSAQEADDEDETEEAPSADAQLSESVHSPAVQAVVENEPSETKPTDEIEPHEMAVSSPKADISDGVSCMSPEAHHREPVSPGYTNSDHRPPSPDMGEEVEYVHERASSESPHSESEGQGDKDDRGSRETEEISKRAVADEGEENTTSDLLGNSSTNTSVECNEKSDNTSEGTHNESRTFHVVPTIEDLYNDLELSNDSTVNDLGNQPKVSLKDCSGNMQLVEKQTEIHEETDTIVVSQDQLPCSQASTDVSNFAAAVDYKGNCVTFIASPNGADVATESSIVVSPRSCSPVVIDTGSETDDAVAKNDVENTTSDEAQSSSANVLDSCCLADVPIKDDITSAPRIYSSEEGIVAILINTTDPSLPKSNICSNQSLLTNAEPIDEGEQDEHSLNTTGAVSKDDTITNDEVSVEPTEKVVLTAETFDGISLEKTADASIRETAAGLEVEIGVDTSVCKAERIDSKKHVQDRVEPAESVMESGRAEPADGTTPQSNTTVNDNQTCEGPSLESNDGWLDDQTGTKCSNTVSIEQETDLGRTKMIVDLERDENTESSGNGKDDTVECMTKDKTEPMGVLGNVNKQQQETEDGILRNADEHDENVEKERPIIGCVYFVESTDKCEEPKSSVNVTITGEDEVTECEGQEAAVTKNDSKSDDITTESETDTSHAEIEMLSSGKLNDQPDASGKLDQTSTDNVTKSETKEEDTDKSVTAQSNGEEDIGEDDKGTPTKQTPALENSTVEEPKSPDDGLEEEKTTPKCGTFLNEVTKFETDVEMAQDKKATMSQPDENTSADAKQTTDETQLHQGNKQRNTQVCGDILMQTNNIDTKSVVPVVAKTAHDEMAARGPPRKFLKERHMRSRQMDVVKHATTEASCESVSADGRCTDAKSTESSVDSEFATRGYISPSVMTTPPGKRGVRASTSNELLCYEEAQKGRCLYFLGQYTSEEPVTTDSATAYAKVELQATPSNVEITPAADVETQQGSGNDVGRVPVDGAVHGILLQENKDSVRRTTTEQFDEEDKERPDTVGSQESERGSNVPTSLGKTSDSASAATVIEVKTGISNAEISEEEGELIIDQSGFEERDDHKESDDQKTCSEDKPVVAFPTGSEGHDGKTGGTTGSDQLASTANVEIDAKNKKLGQLIKSLKSTISLNADPSPIPTIEEVTTQGIHSNVKELDNKVKPETERKCRRRKPVEKLKVFNTRARTLSESLSAGAESDPGTSVNAKREVKVSTRAGCGRGRGHGRVSPRGSRGTGRARSADPADGVSVALKVKLKSMTSPVMPVSSPSPSSPPPLIAVYPVPVKKRRQCRRPKADHTEEEKPKPKTSRRSRRSKKRNENADDADELPTIRPPKRRRFSRRLSAGRRPDRIAKDLPRHNWLPKKMLMADDGEEEKGENSKKSNSKTVLVLQTCNVSRGLTTEGRAPSTLTRVKVLH